MDNHEYQLKRIADSLEKLVGQLTDVSKQQVKLKDLVYRSAYSQAPETKAVIKDEPKFEYLLYGRPVMMIYHDLSPTKHRLTIEYLSLDGSNKVTYGSWVSRSRVAILENFRAVDVEFHNSLPEVFYLDKSVRSYRRVDYHVDDVPTQGGKWRRFWSEAFTKSTNHQER